ncbi:MAG: AtpZ/AtpI family protein [Candidatus Omnitrophica bacterium]|nr:AtpZ/AtpI family protein [Candidatus Omnitrophota bacterium]
MEKKNFYQWVRVYGLLSYIPLILAAGPLGGFFLGDYLEKRFGWPGFISLIFAGLGFLSAALETIRIIRLVAKIEKREG